MLLSAATTTKLELFRVSIKMAGVQSRNEMEFDVKSKLTEALYFTCGSYISRFPYVLAILLMLETGEMFKTSLSVDQSRLTMAYAHLGGYFLAATAMSFNLFQAKRTFALFTAMQFGVLSVECYLETERREGLLVSIIWCWFTQFKSKFDGWTSV